MNLFEAFSVWAGKQAVIGHELFKKNRLVLAFLLLAGSCIAPVMAEPSQETQPEARACFHRVCFPAAAEVYGQSLPLRSAGKKDFWKFSIYDAGIYLPSSLSKQDFLNDVPKKIVLRYRRTLDKEKIIQAAEHHLARNPEVDLAAIRERVDYLHSLYRSVKQGDEYALAYMPEQGTRLYFNGEPQGGSIPGNDFAKAYFGIWLSKYVVCKKLRWELLDLH